MLRVLTVGGLVASVGLGSWWTAEAVAAGDELGMFLRFGLGTVAGAYYLVLYRALTAAGRPEAPTG